MEGYAARILMHQFIMVAVAQKLTTSLMYRTRTTIYLVLAVNVMAEMPVSEKYMLKIQVPLALW